MHKKPLCLLLPGLGESTRRAPYMALRKVLIRRGYDVIGVNIIWSRRTLTDWVEQAVISVPKGVRRVDLMIGFSFGALIALILATKLRPRKVIAASASPYFYDDLKRFPKNLYRRAERFLGKKRMSDFKMYRMSMLSSLRGKTSVDFVVAENDFPIIPVSTRHMKRAIGSRARIFEANGAPHDIGHPSYLKTCISLIDVKKKKAALVPLPLAGSNASTFLLRES